MWEKEWPLTLTLDLLIWISRGIIYSSQTIYLLRLKLLRQGVPELSVAQGVEDQHDLLHTDLNINWDHLLIKDYLPTKFEATGARCSWVQLHKVWERDMTFDLDLWPTDLNIHKYHLLIKDYLPTTFEVSGAKPSWVISCARLRETDIPTRPTYRPTEGHVQSNMPLLLSKGS